MEELCEQSEGLWRSVQCPGSLRRLRLHEWTANAGTDVQPAELQATVCLAS